MLVNPQWWIFFPKKVDKGILFVIYIDIMKEHLTILKEHFKTNQALAKELGVTDRHIRYILKDEEKASEPLKKLIKLRAELLEIGQ